MSQTARFQETLRRLAMVDEGFVEDEAGLGLGLGRTTTLDPKAVALLQLGVSVAIGSAAVRLPRGAMGILSARYESGIVAMSDNGLPLPAAKFATVDLGAVLPIWEGMSVQAGVKNLLDRNYYYWEGFPEEGRNYYVTLRYKF